jgi:hypothetical protein
MGTSGIEWAERNPEKRLKKPNKAILRKGVDLGIWGG